MDRIEDRIADISFKNFVDTFVQDTSKARLRGRE
jgi:hypothetical protein